MTDAAIKAALRADAGEGRNVIPDPNALILYAAWVEAMRFFDFPADRAFTERQRAQLVALSHKIACRRGWAPRDLITGLPRDTAALLARADVVLAAQAQG